MATATKARANKADGEVSVRRVQAGDLPQVIGLDTRVTKLAKNEYWVDVFKRYGRQRLHERFFLVAENRVDARVIGFIVGEIRAWEFGSTPCGWIFALSVVPEMRQRNVGNALFETIAGEFKKAGVNKMRTMVANDARLPLLFFRGEGMMAGPYLQLEKDID